MFAAPNIFQTSTKHVFVDSVGGGFNGSTSSCAWQHTIKGNALVLGLNLNCSSPFSNASCGGVAMTSCVDFSYTTGFAVQIFALNNPPTGLQTINLFGPASGYIAANTVSFYNVANTLTNTYGWDASSSPTTLSGLTAMQNAPPNSSDFVVCGSTSSGSFSGFSGTTLFNQPYSFGVNYPALIGALPATNSSCSVTSPGGSLGMAGIYLYA